MAFADEKARDGTFSSAAFSSNEPSRTQSGMDSIAEFEKKDLVYKRRIRILRFLSRFISLILSAFMTGVLSFALSKYYLTRHHILPDNSHPWVTPITLWPTFMLLAISIVTVMLNFLTICTYVCGVNAANKMGSVTSFIGYVMLAIHVVVWAVAVGLFKMANTGSDLWGYTCSDRADAIQAKFSSFMNFGQLCMVQNGAWYASIIEAIGYGLTFVLTLLILKRASHKKKLAKAKEILEREGEYTQQIEMGTIYKPGNGTRYMPVAEDARHI